VYCGATWKSGLTLDHLEPRARGGADCVDNLVSACDACNKAKGTASALVFIAREARAGRRLGHRADFVPPPPVPRPPRHSRSVAFIPDRIAQDRGLSFQGLLAYLVLSTTSDADGWCWPNGRELARLARRDARFSSVALSELERRGYLKRHRVPSPIGPQLVIRLLLTAAERHAVLRLPALSASVDSLSA
jgi:hypothetical protein